MISRDVNGSSMDARLADEAVEAIRSGKPVVRELLPGALTLILPNPARRFEQLTGRRAERIGVRVPDLPEPAREILNRAGPVAATSANLAGGLDPRRLDDVPDEIRSGCAVVVDGGELPGTPSTVVDLTGPEPRVLREGAAPADEVLARLTGPVR